jgi:hypothetical protein
MPPKNAQLPILSASHVRIEIKYEKKYIQLLQELRTHTIGNISAYICDR